MVISVANSTVRSFSPRLLLNSVRTTTSAPQVILTTVQWLATNFSSTLSFDVDDVGNGTEAWLGHSDGGNSTHMRIKRAKGKSSSDYEYDYTDPNGKLDKETWTEIYYGIAFVLSFVLIIIQFYTSLLGRRMRNEGLRWHVVFCSIFNMIQLFIYADTADSSPWQDYLRNVYIIKHIVAIEQITLSAFPASVCILVPLYLLTYGSPQLRQTFVFKWFIWLVVYGGLAAGSGFIGCKYYKSLDGSGSLPDNPLTGYWQFYANAVSWLMIIIMLIVALIGSTCMISYATMNFSSVEKQTLGQKFSDNTSLLSIWAYILTVTIFHMPKNLLNMASFFMTNILPKLVSLMEWYQSAMAPAKGSNNTTAAPATDPTQAALSLLLSYSAYITAFLDFVPVSELLIPIVEFLAAAIFLKMYRESLLNLLSCGACYRSDKNGSVWDIIPYRYRSIYPLEALRWASPAMVAQGLVPPAPAGFAMDNGPMAIVHTSASGKSPILVETI